MSDSNQSYEEYQGELKSEQKDMSREQIRKHLQEKRDETGKPFYSDIFDPDNLPPIRHRWIDRGAVMSCEGAAHPAHRAFKRR